MLRADWRQGRRHYGREVWIRRFLGANALLAALSVVGIFGFLVYFTLPLLTGGRWDQVLTWQWQPFQGQFGILPMVVGTMALSMAALLLAFPLAVGVSSFVHLYRQRPLGKLAGAVVRLMTGIPTVVYGFAAVFLLVPWVRRLGGHGSGFSWLAATLILALLILPTMVLIIDSQLTQLDEHLRLTTASLGLTPPQELWWIFFPGISRGLVAAGILGFGRAAGDTLVALMLSGNAPQVPHSPLDSIRVLTAHIALVVATDSQSTAYHSIFASGLILFLISAGVNLTVQWLQPEAGGPTKRS